jgi:hypothetical protein
MQTATIIREKLTRIKSQVNPKKYNTASAVIETYAANSTGTGHLNTLANIRLTAIARMSEQDMINAIEGI